MKKLVIILSEKAPDTKHICFEGGCPLAEVESEWLDKILKQKDANRE